MRSRWRWAGLAALVLLAAAPAEGHDFNPGVLSLVEIGDGRFSIAWTPPVDSTGSAADVEVVLPPQCARTGDRVDCGEAGLVGEIAFTRIHASRMKIVVLVNRLDGAVTEHLVSGSDPRVRVDERSRRSARLWLTLGVEHILGGLDHLAFVIGLLLLLDFSVNRRLLATISAFTAAHSVTLALAALDVVRLPAAPVEAAIAASVVLVAREALRDRPTATRRWPWLAAGGFGLVHGLGFAGALAGFGLPRDAVASSLLWFNLGVELGQLAVVAVAVLLARLLAALTLRLVLDRDRGAAWANRGVAYLLGSLGVAWFLARAADLLLNA